MLTKLTFPHISISGNSTRPPWKCVICVCYTFLWWRLPPCWKLIRRPIIGNYATMTDRYCVRDLFDRDF